MTEYQYLIDSGYNHKNAQSVIDMENRRIGTTHYDFTITDINRDICNGTQIITLKCNKCGDEIEKQYKLAGFKFHSMQRQCLACRKEMNKKIKSDVQCEKNKNPKIKKPQKKFVEKYTSDYIGKKYGKLEIIGISRLDDKKVFVCKCDCGNTVKKKPTHVVNGIIKACGCESLVNKCRFQGNKNERLYAIYCGMIRRCNNPNEIAYNNYGGRGIKVCSEWENDYFAFEKWALSNGYDEKLSIDRINVNGNYEPSNCKWATAKEQANNRRNNRLFEHNGEMMTSSQIAEIENVSDSDRLFYYLDRGYSVPSAVQKAKGLKRNNSSNFSNMILILNGIENTLTEWCDLLEIGIETVRYRVKHKGMSLEEALTTPKMISGRHHKEII